MGAQDLKIELKNVYFSYDDIDVLRGLDLTVSKGEFVCILGRNGSGKSTIAKLTNALLMPKSGEITVCGINTKDVSKIFDIRKRVGMIFQNPDNQLIATTVEEEIAFGMENLLISPEIMKTRIKKVLKQVDMEGFENIPPFTLSGGQKQRIAIASVLAMEPDFIIFDEATSMLDPKGREEILKIALKLQNLGVGIFWITHFVEEATKASKIVILEKGKKILEGKKEDIFLQTKILKNCNIIPPFCITITQKLAKKDFDIEVLYRDQERLVDDICQLL